MHSHNGYESPILPSSMSSDILYKNGEKFQDTGSQRREDMQYKFEVHWLYTYNMLLGTAHTDFLLLYSVSGGLSSPTWTAFEM